MHGPDRWANERQQKVAIRAFISVCRLLLFLVNLCLASHPPPYYDYPPPCRLNYYTCWIRLTTRSWWWVSRLDIWMLYYVIGMLWARSDKLRWSDFLNKCFCRSVAAFSWRPHTLPDCTCVWRESVPGKNDAANWLCFRAVLSRDEKTKVPI